MKKQFLYALSPFILGQVLVLASCAPAAEALPQATISIEQPAVTKPADAGPLATTATSQEINETASFPLSKPGPYFAGNRAYSFVDENRGGREVKVTIWYPALEQKDANGRTIRRDAAPNTSRAPYPLILTEQNSGSMMFQSLLATHGFVMAQINIPDHDDYDLTWDFNFLSWPQDFLFALDQIAATPLAGLEGVIDTEKVGATGYSFGGDISLTLGGARIDPEYYLSHCKQPPPIESKYSGAEGYLEITCSLAKKWDEFSVFAGEEITAGQEGLWQPVSDKRIRAVMPMAPSGAWLYGERGLAAVDRPVMMIAMSEDELIPYSSETAFIFKHFGDPESSLVSFLGNTHLDVFDARAANRMKHFVVAFFGYHLQGRVDYLKFFSENFVSQFGDLAWGIYTGD